MRHGLHHGACAMPLDRLVEVAGGKPEPVCLLAGFDLALGSLVQAGTVLVGLFLLVRPCSLESSDSSTEFVSVLWMAETTSRGDGCVVFSTLPSPAPGFSRVRASSSIMAWMGPSSAGPVAGCMSCRRRRRSERPCISSISKADGSGSGLAARAARLWRRARWARRRLRVAAWRCLASRASLACSSWATTIGWAQVDAGEIVGPGFLVRAAAVVGPILDQDQALLAQGGEMLLHGALIASSKSRNRGVAGGEHRGAAQAPAAVEGQEGAQGADHAGTQAKLTSALLQHPACGCGVRQGGGKALVGRGTPSRDRRPGAARGHAQGWPSKLVQLSIVLVLRSHAPVHARRRAPAGGRCATRTTDRACAKRQHAL